MGRLRRLRGLHSRNLYFSSIAPNTLIQQSSYHYPLLSTALSIRSVTNWATKSTFEPKPTEDSWAAARLEEVGENLLPSEFEAAEEYVELTQEIIQSTTPRVDYLVKEILALNELEKQELQNIIQVRYSSCHINN